MRTAFFAATAVLAASMPGARALPLYPHLAEVPSLVLVNWSQQRRQYPPEGSRSIQEGAGYVNENGGYAVNRYGYGNYFGGPGGGFAGYPAGSGAAFVYQQQHQWKCHYIPERC